MLLIQTLTVNVIHATSERSASGGNWGYFAHLSDQFVADCIHLGLDALLTLSCVLVVNRKVKAQEVVHGSVSSCEESHVNINKFSLFSLWVIKDWRYLVLGPRCRPRVPWSGREEVWLHPVEGCSGDPRHSGLCAPRRMLLSPERRPCNSRTPAPSAPAYSPPGWRGSRWACPACRGHSGLALAPPLETSWPQPQTPPLPLLLPSHIIQASPDKSLLCASVCFPLNGFLCSAAGIHIYIYLEIRPPAGKPLETAHDPAWCA